MEKLRFFMDTHHREQGTFPENLSPVDFAAFYSGYEKACQEEGVIPIRAHIGFDDGRAYCFNMAPDADAVRRAHEKVNLPFDSITEVTTATPGDMFLQCR